MAAEPRDGDIATIIADAWQALPKTPVVFRSSVIMRVISKLMDKYQDATFRYGDNMDRDVVYADGDFDFAVRATAARDVHRLVRDLMACPSVQSHGCRRMPKITRSVSEAEAASRWHFFSILDVRARAEIENEVPCLIRDAFKKSAADLLKPYLAAPIYIHGKVQLPRLVWLVRSLGASHAHRRRMFDVFWDESDEGPNLCACFLPPRAASSAFIAQRRRSIIYHFCHTVLDSGLGSSVASVKDFHGSQTHKTALRFKLTGLEDPSVMAKLEALC